MARPAPADQPYGILNQEYVPHIIDFNKDGIPDLLLFDTYEGIVYLYLGSVPGGSFYSAGTLQTADCNVSDMAVGDLNGDGYPDAVFLCNGYSGGNTIYVAFNKSGASFGSQTQIGTTYASQLALGDFNHDGKLDLLAVGAINATGTTGFQVYLGNGQGGFGASAANPNGQASQQVTSQFGAGTELKIADFNNDGYADFAVENYSIGSLAVGINVFQNNGGTFSAVPTANLPTPAYGQDYYIAPLTTGGFPSIVTRQSGSGSNVIVWVNGGSSTAHFTVSTPPTPSSLSSISVGDYNGDGYLDIALYDGRAVTLDLGSAGGSFTAAPSTWTASLPNSVLLSSFDQNGDGYADLLTTVPPSSGTSGSLQTLVTTGSATATYNAGALPVGSNQVSASYPGTVGLSGATATTTVQVNGLTPTVVFTKPDPIVYGTTLSSAQLQASANYNGTPVAGSFTFSPVAGTVLRVGTQTLSVTFVPADPTYTTAQASTTIVVTRAVPALTWAAPSAITYGTALSSTQLNASSGTVQGSFVYTPVAGTVLNVGTQTLSAAFTPSDTQDYQNATVTTTLAVNSGSLTINWVAPTAITYGTALSSAQLNATVSGNVPGTFTYSPAAGTVLNAGTQTLGVTFTPNDRANYQPVSATTTLTVNKVPTTLSWATPSPITYGTALSSAQLNAAVVGGVAGTLTYTPASGTVSNAGAQLLSVSFSPTNNNYLPSTATTTLTVNKFVPVLTWTAPAAISYGTPLSSTQLNASVANNIPGTFAYAPAAGTVLSVGTQTLGVTFTPSDLQNYQTVTGTTSLFINSGSYTINWPAPAGITYGTALSAAQLNATGSGNIPGTFAYTPAAGTVLNAGTQTLSVTFTPNDSVNYRTLTASTTIVVSKVTPLLSWPTPAAITYGTTLTGAQLNASVAGSIAGTLTYSPATGALLNAGMQVLNVTFAPTDSVNYQTVTATTNLIVNKALPSLSWSNPAAIAYGTALSAIQLNASVAGNLPGTLVYNPVAGTVLAAGTHSLGVTFTPTDTVDYQTVNGSTSIVVNSASSTIGWATPAGITYGTALSATQLNATVSGNIPGTFAYTPAAGAVLSAGTQTLSVTFTPTDSVNYRTLTASTTIVVSKVTPLLSWATPSAITYGAPVSAAQLNASVADSTPGTLTYAPAAGTVLNAGLQVLSVTFTPADTVNYQSATASTTLTINKALPALTWANPGAINYGTPLSTTQLNALVSGNLAGVLTYIPAAGTVLGVGSQTLNVTFTPSDTRDYQTATATALIVVNSAAVTVNWTSPTAITYGTPLSSVQLNATVAGNITGTFAYSPSAGTVLNAGTQTLGVTFTPNDLQNYRTLTASTTITVNKASPSLTWMMPTPVTFGTALSPTQLNAVVANNVPGTITYTPALGSVLPVGVQPLTAVFAPTDTTNYLGATASTTLVVNRASSALTWNAPAPIVYGTPLSATQLNATINGGLAGTLTYSPAAGTVLNAGVQTASVTFTPSDSTSTLPSTAAVAITVNKATPLLTWAQPTGAYIGSTLTTAQLNASAIGVTGSALPGTYVYTPSVGSVITSSTTTLSVVFTPTDAANYTNATQSVPLSIQSAQVTSVNPSTVTLGSTATTITVTGTGFAADATIQVNGTSLPTTVVNSTTLTAVLPASSAQIVKALPVTVIEPAESQTSPAINLPVVAPPANFLFSVPTTSSSADQPKLNLTLVNPYPVDLTGVLTLSFTPASGSVDDPAIRFSTGTGNGRTATFVVPANSTLTPNIALQTGTVLGRIQANLVLTAGGAVVTPATVQPLTITPNAAPPVITTVSSSVNGSALTVTVTGYSNTRDLSQASFHFTSNGGPALSNPDVTVPVNTLFTNWYSSTNSTQYGSTFLYTQTFNLSNDFTGISKVSVTLVNTVGTSQAASTP